MTIQQLIVLLPCYSLEDLQLDRNDEDAEQLLSAWTTLYHPLLLHKVRFLPRWERAYDPPSDPENALIALPTVSETCLPASWMENLNPEKVILLRNFKDQPELRRQMEAAWPEPWPQFEESILQQFFALGFAHLQAELMTRQLRYMSNLDEIRFRESALKAAEAACCGEPDKVRSHLQRAFDLLSESREYFYPVQNHLIDLTLTADTTLGAGLLRELREGGRINLEMTGSLAAKLARSYPETLAELKQALAENRAAIVGGEYQEGPLTLLPQSLWVRNFQRGRAEYESHLQTSPVVFGRRRYGLSPHLPGILAAAGFVGALHFALDDGGFPVGNQSKFRWEGEDGQSVDALGRIPLDASRPSTFLKLADSVGRILDLDHAATTIFAHWPDAVSPWYRLLRITAGYSPVLGAFRLLPEYFRDTQYVGGRTQHPAERYTSPYLKQWVADGLPDPISRWTQLFRLLVKAESVVNVLVMRALVTGRWDQKASEIRAAVTGLLEDAAYEAEKPVDHQAIAARVGDCERMLAGAVRLFAENLFQTAAAKDAEGSGHILLNSHPFSQRGHVLLAGTEFPPKTERPVLATGARGSDPVVVEVPAFSYWAIPRSDVPYQPEVEKRRGLFSRRVTDETSLRVEGLAVQNEFFRLKVDETTGGIAAFAAAPVGRNLLGQKLALRLPIASDADDGEADDPERHYSRMIAESVEVACPGPPVAEIVSRGRLVNLAGDLVARFEQRVSVAQRLPIARIKIHLEPERLPDGPPWANYYACRFAWNDETAEVYGSSGWCRGKTEVSLLESPWYVHLATQKHALTFLAPGLPFHRRIGLRRLDTLLIVKGETAREFELGIGLDLRYPLQAALQVIEPPAAVPIVSALPNPACAWMIHVDVRNVLVTGMSPLSEEERLTGLRLELWESEGRAGDAVIRFCRPVRSAYRLDLWQREVEPLPAAEDAVTVSFARFQRRAIEVRFRDA
ncbi:MAG: hypothetical protein GYA33_06280 [Thermogutta sp.]|nr:hypothetical protein [Thermogutta sp.]